MSLYYLQSTAGTNDGLMEALLGLGSLFKALNFLVLSKKIKTSAQIVHKHYRECIYTYSRKYKNRY